MVSKMDKNIQRLKRHRRVRGKISGTAERPRLNVYRSTNHIYAQVIDDVKGVTLVTASSTEKDFGMTGGNKEAARKVGKLIGERAKAAGIQRLVDIVICDGGSTDGSLAPDFLAGVGVSALLTKRGPGRQGAQLRMGIHWALARGYDAVLTIDGNDKDSIESVPSASKNSKKAMTSSRARAFSPAAPPSARRASAISPCACCMPPSFR